MLRLVAGPRPPARTRKQHRYNGRVHRYRPDKQPRDLDTLVASKLYSATIDSLNDPFEFAALRALADHPEKLVEHQSVGVTCFCRSITNPLLWSHYAAGHRGFAIGYDAAHPHFGGNQGIGKRFLLDVRYEDVSPSVERFGIDGIQMAAMLTKPTCWSYEQEVRLVKQRGNEAFDIPPDMIKEIIFGARMAPDRIEEIMSAMKAAGIRAEFSQMHFLDEGYGVKRVLSASVREAAVGDGVDCRSILQPEDDRCSGSSQRAGK